MSSDKPAGFHCPMPELNFDTITLAHGSGGKLTRLLLDSMVIPNLKNPWLDEQGDGALLDLNGPVAFSTDSFVVSPLFFPGGCIGDLAVNGTVNDVAMCGAKPEFLSLSFIIEEGLPVEEFWNILMAVRDACLNAYVKVVTGDTKVVERGKGDGIFINTTGMGRVHPKAKLASSRIKPGDKVILSGPLAEHGVAIMSKRKGLEFESAIVSDTRPLHNITQKLVDVFGKKLHLFRDPTRGGVAAVLHEIALRNKLGVEIEESSLPVHPEVAGACEMLGLDPLYIANEGLFLTFASPENADQIVAEIQNWTFGKQATVIGTITDEHPGKVLLKSTIGGRRVLPDISGEILPRIC